MLEVVCRERGVCSVVLEAVVVKPAADVRRAVYWYLDRRFFCGNAT